jgi:hydrogenase maturation protease
MKRYCIVGLGSPLHHDDGVGILLLEKLSKYEKNELVKYDFIDGGPGGMDIIHIINRYDVIVIIDAVRYNGDPGSIRIFSPKDVHSLKSNMRLSTHHQDILKIIDIAEKLTQKKSKIIIAGIQPADLSFGEGLSQELQRNIHDIEDKLFKYVKNLDLADF